MRAVNVEDGLNKESRKAGKGWVDEQRKVVQDKPLTYA